MISIRQHTRNQRRIDSVLVPAPTIEPRTIDGALIRKIVGDHWNQFDPDLKFYDTVTIAGVTLFTGVTDHNKRTEIGARLFQSSPRRGSQIHTGSSTVYQIFHISHRFGWVVS